jgi:hypothetical protein
MDQMQAKEQQFHYRPQQYQKYLHHRPPIEASGGGNIQMNQLLPDSGLYQTAQQYSHYYGPTEGGGTTGYLLYYPRSY